MAHGYLEDGYGIDGGMDRGRDRGRDRGWRDGDRREHGWHERDRGMMFEGRERDRSDDHGWSDRGWRREHSEFGDDSEGRGRFSANPDDHYRSWRDRHMSELDRDYADYCREREARFHSEFDAWRRQRHASYQPLRTGMTNSGLSHDPSGEVQQATEGTPPVNDPTGAATLGTNDEPQSGTGRGGRR
jgi:hypothetical protein